MVIIVNYIELTKEYELQLIPHLEPSTYLEC